MTAVWQTYASRWQGSCGSNVTRPPDAYYTSAASTRGRYAWREKRARERAVVCARSLKECAAASSYHVRHDHIAHDACGADYNDGHPAHLGSEGLHWRLEREVAPGTYLTRSAFDMRVCRLVDWGLSLRARALYAAIRSCRWISRGEARAFYISGDRRRTASPTLP